jgi:predicted nuclease with TOPRIM domain
MPKKHNKREQEEVRGIVRKLQKENQKLKRALSRYDKRAHQYDDLEEREQEFELESHVEKHHVVKQIPTCPKCSGKLDAVPIGNRLLITCQECDYRKTEKKNA